MKFTIFSDLINSGPQICTSPWYLLSCPTCSNRTWSCPVSPIAGIFYTVVWAYRAGMFRNGQNVTKLQFFIKSIDFDTRIWTFASYLHSCVTCLNRLWSCLRSPIRGIFCTVAWVDRAGMVRNGENVTKRTVFQKIHAHKEWIFPKLQETVDSWRRRICYRSRYLESPLRSAPVFSAPIPHRNILLRKTTARILTHWIFEMIDYLKDTSRAFSDRHPFKPSPCAVARFSGKTIFERIVLLHTAAYLVRTAHSGAPNELKACR